LSAAYVIAGVLSTVIAEEVGWYWLDIFGGILPGVTYETRPPWLCAVMRVARDFPWAAIAVLAVWRMLGFKQVRPLAFAAGVVAPWVLFFGYVFFGPTLLDHFHRRSFERIAWQSNAGANSTWPARLTMVDDLLHGHHLTGMTRTEIVTLLGPPDDRTPFRNWDLVYWLGPERGLFRIDSEWLLIDLDAKGAVAKYVVATD
jgi:hypothetical protein